MIKNIMLEMNCLFRLIQTSEENADLTGTIKDVKRDKYVFIIAWIFIFTLLIVGKKQGLFSIISLHRQCRFVILCIRCLCKYIKHKSCYSYAV